MQYSRLPAGTDLKRECGNSASMTLRHTGAPDLSRAKSRDWRNLGLNLGEGLNHLAKSVFC